MGTAVEVVRDRGDDIVRSLAMMKRSFADWIRNADRLRAAGAVMGLLALTTITVLVYTVRPQSPRDFADRLALEAGLDVYGASIRVGDRWLSRSRRAEAVGADSLAEVFTVRASEALTRAARTASGAEEELAANDRLAGAYLRLGWEYLERGRGGRFGIGRRPTALEAAEGIGLCVVGVAPTRLRAEINAFIEELEAVLERPLEGRCRR